MWENWNSEGGTDESFGGTVTTVVSLIFWIEDRLCGEWIGVGGRDVGRVGW